MKYARDVERWKRAEEGVRQQELFGWVINEDIIVSRIWFRLVWVDVGKVNPTKQSATSHCLEVVFLYFFFLCIIFE